MYLKLCVLMFSDFIKIIILLTIIRPDVSINWCFVIITPSNANLHQVVIRHTTRESKHMPFHRTNEF